MEHAESMGGNSLILWYGKLLSKISNYYSNRSEKYIKKGRKTIILNPRCQFVSRFALMLDFTVDVNSKYQLVIQGDFKEKYKEWEETNKQEMPVGDQEMFEIIKNHKDRWYLKE